MKKVAAITFGCRVNQYETTCVVNDFIRTGYQFVNFNEPADVYIINTCSVTNRTDYKSRNAIRKALLYKKKNPDIKIVVTGCYSQIKYEEVRKMGDIDLIVDNNKKGNIPEYILGSIYSRYGYSTQHSLHLNADKFEDILDATEFAEISFSSMINKTRAYIKVQDGCDFYCAYCIVPYGRGSPRSRGKVNILNQIRQLVKNGYKEFVIGGINLGLYGREKNDGYFLSNLLADIEEIEGVKIIRLSSLEPQLFTENLLSYFKESNKIAKHFHIPLQVGCDELLNAMGRKYSISEFSNIIKKLYQIFPNAALGFDIIAGLPGETEDFFKKNLSFLELIDFAYLHVFSYSKRPGTRAAEMSGQINGEIIKKRCNTLMRLSESKKNKYRNKILRNKIKLSGIIEMNDKGYWTALSNHYIRIYLENKNNLERKYVETIPIENIFDGVKVENND